jgi:hypothetical protein
MAGKFMKEMFLNGVVVVLAFFWWKYSLLENIFLISIFKMGEPRKLYEVELIGFFFGC